MKLNDITYLDLFSGTGGFAKGFLDAGFEFKNHYFSEIDKHAIANYKFNFKHAEYAGDIRFISKLEQRPNLITFGFPCQDLSIAGKGAGFTGTRSVLFFEAVRLIKEYLPEVFIFENVKGLLSHNEGQTFETVLRTIADIGLYECEWQLLNTSWVLPQNRERIYFIGHLRGASRPRVFPIGENDSRINERQRETANSRTLLCGTNGGLNSHNTLIKTLTDGGHSGGLHSSMSLLKVGREMKSNLCPSLSARQRSDGSGQPVINDTRRLTEIEWERLQGFQDNWTKYGDYNGVIKEISKTQRYKMLGNAVTTKIVKLVATKLKYETFTVLTPEQVENDRCKSIKYLM